MQPLKRDPAPSRLAYRLHRVWLRPSVRAGVRYGAPLALVALLVWGLLERGGLAEKLGDTYAALRAEIAARPEFALTRLDVVGASSVLEFQVREAAAVDLPASSLDLDMVAVRDRVAALAPVAEAVVRSKGGGVLEIRVRERHPVIVERTVDGLVLRDIDGVPLGPVPRRDAVPEFAVMAGIGAATQVPEALAILSAAAPVADRIRGLERIGARRWNLVLDSVTIMLPEDQPVRALARTLTLHAATDLFDRDVVAVDLRDPRRPTLRLTETARAEYARLREMMREEGG